MFDEAKHVLDMICETHTVQANGVIGLFPAYSLDDDVVVLNKEKTDKIATLYGLRQQVRIFNASVCSVIDCALGHIQLCAEIQI